MIRIRVELISAITGKTTEIARMHIANTGQGTHTRGDYTGQTFKGRSLTALNKHVVNRHARVENYPRQQIHVWNLVARMLASMGYK